MIVTPDIVGPVKNGGIGTACLQYAKVIVQAGRTVDVLFTGTVEPQAKRRWTRWYADLGITFSTIDDVPPLTKSTYGTSWYTEVSLRLFNYLRERSHKYIIFQDWHGNGFWSARAKQMGVAFAQTRLAVIAHSPNEWQRRGMEHHGEAPFERADLEWVEREAIAAADILISPSRHMIDWLGAHGYALPSRVEQCPIPFEDERLEPVAGGPDHSHLVFFGRLETRKGLHLLAEALRLLKAEDRLPRKLSLLGKHATVEGRDSRTYLQELAADLPDVEIEIHNDLNYSEAVAYIQRSRGLVVIASLLDNFPLTVVESIANGFCFIASSVGGIPEIADRAVTFEPTAKALKNKLLAVREADWGSIRHPYDPILARENWKTHVAAVLAEPALAEIRAAPGVIGRTRPPTSVCIPFYRHDRYLRRTVAALLQENDSEMQLVVVNDGSPTDELSNFRYLKELLEPAGHIFHTQDNSGVGVARNAAVSMARHDHILFCDSDNVPFPGMLNRLHDAMQSADADCVAVPFAAVQLMDRTPLPSDVWFHYIPPGGSAVRSLVDNMIADAGALIRRAAFESVGGFTTERHSWEDWEFFLRLVLKGHRLRVYPEPLCYYAHAPSGRNESARQYHNRLSLIEALKDAPKDELVSIISVFVRDHLSRVGRL